MNARDHAEALIEDRGIVNALAWAEHCATRTNDPFWRAVCNAIDGVAAQAILDRATANRAAREATRDPITKRLP